MSSNGHGQNQSGAFSAYGAVLDDWQGAAGLRCVRELSDAMDHYIARGGLPCGPYTQTELRAMWDCGESDGHV